MSQPQWFPQPGPPAPPKSGRAKWWVIGGVVVATVVAVVAGLLVWRTMSGSSEGPKPPTASARELLLDESDFPTLHPAGKFTVNANDDDDSDVTVSPAECDELVGNDDNDDPDEDTADAELSNFDADDATDMTAYKVGVTKGEDEDDSTDVDSMVEKCGSVTLEVGDVSFDGTLDRLTVTGTEVPVEAVTVTLATTIADTPVDAVIQMIHGTVRKTSVTVMSNRMSVGSSDSIDATTPDADAVALFDKQIDKIRNAD